MLHWAPLPFNAAPDYAFWLLQREQWASLVVLVDQHKVNNGRCKSLCKSPIMTSISSSSMMMIIIIIKSGIDVMRSYWGRMSRPRRAMLQNNLHGHSSAWIYERSGKYVRWWGGIHHRKQWRWERERSLHHGSAAFGILGYLHPDVVDAPSSPPRNSHSKVAKGLRFDWRAGEETSSSFS